MPRRAGFTLIETLLAVVIVGILVLASFPKITRAKVKGDLRSARTAVANMVVKARTASTISNRKARLTIKGDTVFVTASPRLKAGVGTVDTVGAVENLKTRFGVTLSSSPALDSIMFDPRGLGSGYGASSKLVVSRSGYRDSLTIDGLGRVVQ